MKMSLRNGFWAGAVTVVATAWTFLGVPSLPAADPVTPSKTAATSRSAPAAAKPGQLNEEQLGNLLKAMGLTPKKIESRYDFEFKAVHNKEDWNLSMTAVLSHDGSSIWLMAWLDQLPKSAADVPRTALLRLLSDNDRLGRGKFFAYVATNRRFVLQRVVANENVTTKQFRAWLDDLGTTVAETEEHWSVTNWKTETPTTASAASSNAVKPVAGKIIPKDDDDDDDDDMDDDDAMPVKSAPPGSFQRAGQNPVRTAVTPKVGAAKK